MVRPKGRKSELFSTNMGKEKEAVEGEILQRCKQDLRGTISWEAHGSRLADRSTSGTRSTTYTYLPIYLLVATYEKRRRRKRRVGGAEDEEGAGIGIGTVHCSKEISRDAGSCTGPPINDVP
uniref:Uncharacterized protein n=1 Tax=Vespula pensylvanica TaxID=30213 RepID=A0A834PET2_VESPE|nr:hypothetical protein H0235_000616 [Vespula pensylvanica]